MRQVNFSVPSANKASVGITTALYDRRALDTTSNLPLINSLNNLAYLTTSSARIRDILTIDGGVERLVVILKQGRNSKDMMEGWKWNLAFQCLVNIGVRGSEVVRTRVVQADMVPVIATLLDNYVRVMDKCRARAEAEYSKAPRDHKKRSSRKKHHHHQHDEATVESGAELIRRHPPPPPIEIPSNPLDRQLLGSQAPLSSPARPSTFARGHSHQHSLQNRVTNNLVSASLHLLAAATPAPPTLPNTQGVIENTHRPVQNLDRLQAMLPTLQPELFQPESPTTPNIIPAISNLIHAHDSPSLPPRRPTVRHQLSTSNQSDMVPDESIETPGEILGPIQDSDVQVRDVESDDPEAGGSPVRLEPPAPPQADVDTLDMARSALENTVNSGASNALSMSPVPHQLSAQSSPVQPGPYTRFVVGQNHSNILNAMPSDGDVLMCLQLLAYVSKYCDLRKHFQNSHLVPRLKIKDAHLALIDGSTEDIEMADAESMSDDMDEYLQPDDFNIFPLVEKFTVRHHNPDMQYWARVVMRNLCRKDDLKGGIRQCAYWKCGRWERFTREFAKCRRCRRTKYCSKECQKSAWVFHRHWCVEAQA